MMSKFFEPYICLKIFSWERCDGVNIAKYIYNTKGYSITTVIRYNMKWIFAVNRVEFCRVWKLWYCTGRSISTKLRKSGNNHNGNSTNYEWRSHLNTIMTTMTLIMICITIFIIMMMVKKQIRRFNIYMILAHMQGIIKVSIYWSFVRESTGKQWIFLARDQ